MELNQATFRRLVRLYLLFAVLTLIAAFYEPYGPAWAAFSTDFDALVEMHFPRPQEHWLVAAGVACMISLVWGLASTIGLLSFKRWARFGFWASFLFGLPFLMIPGFYPYHATPWADVLGMLDGALLGAVLLLAYSREHGAIWFNNSAEAAKEG